MGRYGRTPLLVWDEDAYLDLTPAAQHLDYVMRHDPAITPCGRIDWHPTRVIAKARGWTVEQAEQAAAELESAGFAAFDTDTGEAVSIWHLFTDEPLRNPKMAIAVCRAYSSIASRRIRAAVVTGIRREHERNPDFSSWTSPLSAEMVTRVMGLKALEDLPITNRFGYWIGNPDEPAVTNQDRSAIPTGLVIETDAPEDDSDDSITNHITNPVTNQIRSELATGSPITHPPITQQPWGEPNGGTSPSARPENEPPHPEIEIEHESGNGRSFARIPPRTCPRHTAIEPDCADCAETSAVREEFLAAALAATEPPRRCRRHRDVDVNCHDCKANRLIHDDWKRARGVAETERDRAAARDRSVAARQRGETRAAAMAACPLGCGHNPHPGYIDDGQGGTALCDHRPPSRGRPSLREQFDAHKREKAAAQEPDPDPSEPPTTEPAPETPAPTTDAEPEEHEDDRHTA